MACVLGFRRMARERTSSYSLLQREASSPSIESTSLGEEGTWPLGGKGEPMCWSSEKGVARWMLRRSTRTLRERSNSRVVLGSGGRRVFLSPMLWVQDALESGDPEDFGTFSFRSGAKLQAMEVVVGRVGFHGGSTILLLPFTSTTNPSCLERER